MFFASQAPTLNSLWRVTILCPLCELRVLDDPVWLAVATKDPTIGTVLRSLHQHVDRAMTPKEIELCIGDSSRWAVWVYDGRVPTKARTKVLAKSIEDQPALERYFRAFAPAELPDSWTGLKGGTLARGVGRTQVRELFDNARISVTCRFNHKYQLSRSQIVKLADNAKVNGKHEISLNR